MYASYTRLAIGIDIGSTTIKAVVCDPGEPSLTGYSYKRHRGKPDFHLLHLLTKIESDFPAARDIQVFITGSSGKTYAELINARFVQETNALTLAAEKLYPDIGSVIELGGQDAKLIIFREYANEHGHTEKQTFTSMNTRCAAGTGATIDKIISKIQLTEEQTSTIRFDASRTHDVSMKCGVFAETDIVNLLAKGVPSETAISSLANAIVSQNLLLLTQGQTLRHPVLLLGGPNTYLPFLVQCWRMRIKEHWKARGFSFPEDRPIENLVFTPPNAQFYPAFGAIVFGLAEYHDDRQALYPGTSLLRKHIEEQRTARRQATTLDHRTPHHREVTRFLEQYRQPAFVPPMLPPNKEVSGVIGMDAGSTSSKAVLLDAESEEILYKTYTLTSGNPIRDTQQLLAAIKSYVESQNICFRCVGFGVTGYGAEIIDASFKADVHIVETVAHLISATRYFPKADVICDIGGQDIKVIFLAEYENGSRVVKDFFLSNQCSAGNGVLLQSMASQYGVAPNNYAAEAFKATRYPCFSTGCAVFLDSDRINFQREGFSPNEMLAGLAQVLPKNVWQHVVQESGLKKFGHLFVLQGGTQKNLAAVKAQVDYIRDRVPEAKVSVHPHCGEAGAIGAAIACLQTLKRSRQSGFIGLEDAINLKYRSICNDSTVCTFCPNRCSRIFIEMRTPGGFSTRHISGFGCDQGRAETKNALKEHLRKRAQYQKKFPNLVVEEAALAFKHFYEPKPMPVPGSPRRLAELCFSRLSRRNSKNRHADWSRSRTDLSKVKIGLPRALNLYAIAPFFRTYFETLGVPQKNIIWSSLKKNTLDPSTIRCGFSDPCFPAKLAQAHVHELLVEAHTDPTKRRGPLTYIYYPCVTHVPSWVTHTIDKASCPISAGNPNVVKAGFTTETNLFRSSGVVFVDDSVTLAEPNFLKKQLFDTWGARLNLSRDESDWAVYQGFEALKAFNKHMEKRGQALLEQVEREGRVALLMLGRPYHNDPGINHGIPEMFRERGFPILSIRSIPKSSSFLRRYFDPTDPMDIRDVWPENYSANSVQKVWAARFAARHPNITVLDISNFKCGQDAPTYGIINRILATAKVPRATFHDIDANKPASSFQLRVKTYIHTLRTAEAELTRRAASATARFGAIRPQWLEPIYQNFKAEQRPRTTILLGGLTSAHDRLCCSALQGIGYKVEALDCPDKRALELGKEFGNRGQCNPTYFMVGHLLKHLFYLRDRHGLSKKEIIDKYAFLTAGACGPCRFGSYITEYRKALRDAGFEGFRVLLFQQQGGFSQATDKAQGLRINPQFMTSLAKAMICGDVVNLLGYRLRPYEKKQGATDTAVNQCLKILAETLENRWSLIRAFLRCRRILRSIEVDRSVPKPVVSVIGEFWAMTTEGDGNYRLQRFLEQEGAEVDIQVITHWLLFMIWENRHDTRQRIGLKQLDSGRKGLKGKNPHIKLFKLAIAEYLTRANFALFANIAGLHKYRLPDIDKIAALAAPYSDLNVRGGESFMEVGKLLYFLQNRSNHMTVSVKPFGCMPSSGVSDGIQGLVTAKWPDAIFIPIETTGDGEINAHSRVQMMLFKARQRANAEFRRALNETRQTEAAFRQRINTSSRWRNPFRYPKRRAASVATNLVYELSTGHARLPELHE